MTNILIVWNEELPGFQADIQVLEISDPCPILTSEHRQPTHIISFTHSGDLTREISPFALQADTPRHRHSECLVPVTRPVKGKEKAFPGAAESQAQAAPAGMWVAPSRLGACRALAKTALTGRGERALPCPCRARQQRRLALPRAPLGISVHLHLFVGYIVRSRVTPDFY